MPPFPIPLGLSSLPPELLGQIVQRLPIPSLLAFAQTSKHHYSIATSALQTLHLAILPRRIYGVLAFLNSIALDDLEICDSLADSPVLNQITVPSKLPIPYADNGKKTPCLPRDVDGSPAQYREKLFALQNDIAFKILSTPLLSNLQTLSLHLYHLNSSALTALLATSLPHLRRLHLNFSHPYIHDTCLPAHYWTSPVFLKGSPIWNSLVGLGDESAAQLKLRGLESLTLERAGITSVQLRRWIERNPNLRELILRNVAGVDVEFVNWLGDYYGSTYESSSLHPPRRPVRLQTLLLENCPALRLRSIDDFTWLDSLLNIERNPGKKSTTYCSSLSQCLSTLSLRTSNQNSISTPALLQYLESTKPAISQLNLPDGRVFVAKVAKARPTEPKSQRPHVLNSSRARHPSTRSLSDILDNDGDYDEGLGLDDSDEKGILSFLCERKCDISSWVSRAGPRGNEVFPLLSDGVIEVDTETESIVSPGDNRLLRPIVRRVHR